MPLCTTTTRPFMLTWGWALRWLGLPCVAQRVWPMPMCPCQRRVTQHGLKVLQLAHIATDRNAAILRQHRKAGRVIAAILQPLRALPLL
jgi:hypothetical protein